MAFIGWDANTKLGPARNRPRKAKHPIKPMLVQEQPAARRYAPIATHKGMGLKSSTSQARGFIT